MSSLYGGSLELTLIVPYNFFTSNFGSLSIHRRLCGNVELTSTFLLYRGLVHHHHRILNRRLAKGPCVASEKKFEKNVDFFSLRHPRPPMRVHKQFQPNRSSRLAGYTQHCQPLTLRPPPFHVMSSST